MGTGTRTSTGRQANHIKEAQDNRRSQELDAEKGERMCFRVELCQLRPCQAMALMRLSLRTQCRSNPKSLDLDWQAYATSWLLSR